MDVFLPSDHAIRLKEVVHHPDAKIHVNQVRSTDMIYSLSAFLANERTKHSDI